VGVDWIDMAQDRVPWRALVDKVKNTTAFWDIAQCSLVQVDRCFRGTYCLIRAIVLMIEAVRASETSVNFYKSTLHNIPEGCHLHTRRRNNLKSGSIKYRVFLYKLSDYKLLKRKCTPWRYRV
jgi:hypothetical protein